MKKLIILVMLFICVFQIKLIPEGFRGSVWGVSKEDVIKTETIKTVRNEGDMLVCIDKIAGLKVFVAYCFTDNKLYMGKYVSIQKHSNKNDYITDYEKLKNIIEEKYGKFKKDKKYWKNDLYKDKYQDWGFAISLGHLVCESIIDTEETEILLQLSGENYKISLTIQYLSKKIKKNNREDLNKL